MRRRISSLIVAVAPMLVGVEIAANEMPPPIALVAVASGVNGPVAIAHAGDHSARLFIAERTGRVRVCTNSVLLAAPFLDIGSLLATNVSEQGLLGLAFHPEYAANGFFYVNYTRSGDGATVVARYHVSANPNVADPASATTILIVPQPYEIHNGGNLQFGPDGYLYIGMGDGGDPGGPNADPDNMGQRLDTLLGKILRIDVNGGPPYAIPPDNPFANDGDPSTRAEIWALGLRNPWRFSFDWTTGDMFIGDVGEGSFEEVNWQLAGSAGRNYGWRLMEAGHCFNPPDNCTTGTVAGVFTLPIIEYAHSNGLCAVIGGYRYRGQLLPPLVGTYVYGDYCTGRIWGAGPSSNGWWSVTLLDTGALLSTFGQDEQGELYVAEWKSNATIYRVVGADTDGDGLPDWWEQLHFGDPVAADATLDDDGDGFSNLQEFLTGTDPTNSASAFRITGIARQDSTNILVTWMMGPGKTNALERTAGTGGSFSTNNFATIFTVTNTVGSVTNYLDVGATSTSRFYRVRLVP